MFGIVCAASRFIFIFMMEVWIAVLPWQCGSIAFKMGHSTRHLLMRSSGAVVWRKKEGGGTQRFRTSSR